MSRDANRLTESPRRGIRDQTVGAWLAAIEPALPPALDARLSELLAPYNSWSAAHVPEACMEAGERLLEALLISGSTSRATALDLLAVDALVTYAFQAATDEPGHIEARAARAMHRIAALPHTRRD